MIKAPISLTAISSMATRQLLAELAAACAEARGIEIRIESVGGVDAAKRVQAGESFDLVFLARDALAKLATSGHVLADSVRAIADSAVAIAVREGAVRPDIGSEDALRRRVMSARSIGYSTGPSGDALLRLFERWGITNDLSDRLVQARAGVPVASLVASGEAELGFQQRSELMGQPGIALLGGMPAGTEIVTTFSGAIAAASGQAEAARAVLDFMSSKTNDHIAALKKRNGMETPQS